MAGMAGPTAGYLAPTIGKVTATCAQLTPIVERVIPTLERVSARALPRFAVTVKPARASLGNTRGGRR